MPSALSRRMEARAAGIQPAPDTLIREGRIVQEDGNRQVTIDCVQGLGDTYWAYQKVQHHFDRVNFNVMITEPSEVQLRALPFLRLLPKIGTVQAKRVSQDAYNRVASMHAPVKIVLDHSPSTIEYAVNKPLEIGIRLEDIDGDPVEYPRPILPEASLVQGAYGVFYVSGSKALDTWPNPIWADFYAKLMRRYNVSIRTILIGTTYDRWALEEAKAMLASKHGIKADIMADLPIADTLRLIRDARFMVGYQSGLGVMANVFDVPQVWINYNCYPDMLYSWCKRESIESGRFAPFLFQEDQDSIVERCARVFDGVDP